MNEAEVTQAIEEAVEKDALDLSNHAITRVPSSIGRLANLKGLYLRGNPGLTLPAEIGNLASLEFLDLSKTGLTEVPVPKEIGRLKKLRHLDISGNQLATLPMEIMDIPNIDIADNPFTGLSPELVAQGTASILEWFRERRRAGESEQWVSKLVVVGQGGVGKTCLLQALRGEEFAERETTHGIEIGALELPHPDRKEPIPHPNPLLGKEREPGGKSIPMRLNTWDFGGQEIYHATHQFFLTDRSLFLLAWNARQEWEQGKLYYWLDTIKALAPKSPILLVATWTDEREARLPLDDIRGKYPQVVGNWPVSNITGAGIAELKTAIGAAAAKLPLMGEKWPRTSLAAAEGFRARPETNVEPRVLWEIMAAHDVPTHLRTGLAQKLHDLGDILFFQENAEQGPVDAAAAAGGGRAVHEALSDIVILKPEWVARDISKVLECKEVAQKKGVFSRQHMKELWPDLDFHLCDVFLRLMERFDLSYRTLDNKELSLVVELLPLDAPKYEPLWEAHGMGGRPGIAIRYQLNTLPAGIPTWFIAREHKYTTGTHWRSGAVFAQALPDDPKPSADPESFSAMRVALADPASAGYETALAAVKGTHLAFVTADAQKNWVKLTARGPMPANFFALLKDGMEYILTRFPGLEIQRLVPCPGHGDTPCDFEFDLVNLETAAMKGRLTIQCQRTFEDVSVLSLLYGVHAPTTLETKVDEMIMIGRRSEFKLDLVRAKLDDLALKQREFTATYLSDQESVDYRCPNVFTLRRTSRQGLWGRIRDSVAGGEIVLNLCCQQPGEWHPVVKGGRYTIHDPADWLREMTPYLRGLIAVLKVAGPLVGPIGGILDDKAVERFKHEIELMEKLVDDLPDIEENADLTLAKTVGVVGGGGGPSPTTATGRRLRALRKLLDSQDKTDNWGGLETVRTKEGHLLWLCEYHKAQYRS